MVTMIVLIMPSRYIVIIMIVMIIMVIMVVMIVMVVVACLVVVVAHPSSEEAQGQRHI